MHSAFESEKQQGTSTEKSHFKQSLPLSCPTSIEPQKRTTNVAENAAVAVSLSPSIASGDWSNGLMRLEKNTDAEEYTILNLNSHQQMLRQNLSPKMTIQNN